MTLPKYLIKDIPLPDSVDGIYKTDDYESWLSNLSTLNIFIGPNNTGKSLFLRSLFTHTFDNIVSTNPDLHKSKEVVNSLDAFFSTLFPNYNNVFAGRQAELLQHLNDKVTDFSNLSIRILAATRMDAAFVALADLNQSCNTIRSNPHGGSQLHSLIQKLESECAKIDSRLRNLTTNIPEKYEFHKIYLPTLRGLRRMPSTKFEFAKRTTTDYFRNDKSISSFLDSGDNRNSLINNPIITGEEFYDEVLYYLRGNLEQRDTIREYESFLSKLFFDNKSIALIPSIDSDTLSIKIGDENEYPVYNLGDGIQQLLILTMPMFLHRDKNLLLFIEEPELYLHPGYQRLLIKAFLETPGKMSKQLFVTTHSNHFLDITLDSSDIAIFEFRKKLPEGDSRRKKATFKITNTTNEDYAILERLGIRNSSILLSNCTIWVEGITDRYYLRHFLELYMHNQQVKFEEDIHYSFIEYSGSNIAHWSFLDEETGINIKKICNNIFVIADKDSGKDSRHEVMAKALKDQYYVLPCREIENILSPNTITSVVKSYEGPEYSCKPFNETSYAHKYLGRFIENKVLVDKTTSARRSKDGRPYSVESGSIRNKVEFCKKAISSIISIDDLTENTLELSRKMYEFILKCNK